MSSKTKTSLSEAPPGKSSPATPKAARLSRAVNKSETTTSPSSRLSLDRSSPASKSSSSVERRSPKVPTPPERTQARAAAKGSAEPTESRLTLTQIKEDLKKANEKITSLEKEKAKALDELKEAKKESEEASLKLNEALKARKSLEENSEMEKFRAVEEGIEAVQKKEEELKKELENVKNQHASDSASLLLAKQEVQRVNEELAKANEVKSQAEILSSELTRLKALLDSSESEMVAKLEEEIDVLKKDLERARSFEAEVKEQEMIIKKLNADLEDSKKGESCAQSLSEEWKSKARELEEELKEANDLERSASLSLESVMKQLEGSNDKLHDAESELTDLKDQILTLETTIARQKEESEKLSKIEKEVDSLKNKLEAKEEEKNRALDKEQDASLNVQRLLEQRKKLLADLETSKVEEEKSKKAMESLASALHEVSSEGRELKEKLMSQGGGDQEYETQIEDLKLVIKATSEKYETMLDEARHEIDVLVSAVEQTKKHFESSKKEWEMKEANLVDYVKKMEEEVAKMGKEMSRLDGLMKRTEEEADAAWKKEEETRESLKEVEDEVVSLQESLGEAREESVRLKENLLEKETEFESVVQENEELRGKEEVALRKIEELSKLLEEAMLAKKEEEEVELSESDKEYDLLPKVVEFSSENGHRSVEEEEAISNGNGVEEKDMNGKPEEAKTEVKEKKEESVDDDKDDSVEVIFKMWESCQIEKKEAVPDKKAELESQGVEEDSRKVDESDKASTENVDETAEDEVVMEKKLNKKKKTLLGKVGNLLKKKAAVNPK
ncbi:hypothetical protein Rs2_11934 [Raphanus sativus]|uniref:WEB family protein At5g16730, chloroplastic n=1 Tax=Raphanus sativus TaxID=3726 RepID=A0A9W3DC49_RAPSA|nr:WEB family protein At5g16730, chloroplastic [Raphanus sativus]KAJ4908276.1 hypothetical protein Rs2_11934 [Raphanus sativus]